MGSYSSLMKKIPKTEHKKFPSSRAIGVIKADPEGVLNGKDIYKTKRDEGTMKLFKQYFTGLNKAALDGMAELVSKQWKDEFEDDPLSIKILEKVSTFSFNDNAMEELEQSKDGTKMVYFIIKANHSTHTYDLAICFLKSSVQLNTQTLFGGLITEGLLGKDEDDQLYLQL